MSRPGITLDHPDPGLRVVQMWTFLIILHAMCVASANLAAYLAPIAKEHPTAEVRRPRGPGDLGYGNHPGVGSLEKGEPQRAARHG
jgi:hypothetical protein